MTLNASIQRTCNGVSMQVHRLPGLAIFWTQELSFGQLLPITLDPYWRSISQYIDAPFQEVGHEIQSREINQPSNTENPDSSTNHGHSPCFRFYACTSTRRRTWRWPLGRAWWSLGWRQRTSWRQRAWKGLQQAPSRGITLRIRILVPIRIGFRKIALSLVRSRGRRFQKRLRTGLSPGLSSITLRA